jgi:hypothetical protein
MVLLFRCHEYQCTKVHRYKQIELVQRTQSNSAGVSAASIAPAK